jgi:ribonuclease PH
VAAVSVGIYRRQPILDLDYPEDSSADSDLNVVMAEGSQLIEIQGTAEGASFNRRELNALLDLGDHGIAQLIAAQKEALAKD